MFRLYLTTLGRKKGVATCLEKMKAREKGAFHCTITYFWIQMVHFGIRNFVAGILKININHITFRAMVHKHVFFKGISVEKGFCTLSTLHLLLRIHICFF